jgi:hypothetical protein
MKHSISVVFASCLAVISSASWAAAEIDLLPALELPWTGCSGKVLNVNISPGPTQPPISGAATLCIEESRVRGVVAARDLFPGYAYTVWIVYFDNPDNCETPGACAHSDVISPYDPQAVLGRFASGIPNGSEMKFSGAINGLRLSSGSDVRLVVLRHQIASDDNRERARQMLSPEDPELGTPGMGVWVNGPKALGQNMGFARFYPIP